MRFITTFILALLTAGVVAGWAFRDKLAPRLGLVPATVAVSANDLNTITPDSLVRIEIEPDVRLERQGSAWNLPGEWPARQAEVEQLVTVLTGLSPRFAPIPINETLGLDPSQQPVVVKATVRRGETEQTYTL